MPARTGPWRPPPPWRPMRSPIRVGGQTGGTTLHDDAVAGAARVGQFGQAPVRGARSLFGDRPAVANSGLPADRCRETTEVSEPAITWRRTGHIAHGRRPQGSDGGEARGWPLTRFEPRAESRRFGRALENLPEAGAVCALIDRVPELPSWTPCWPPEHERPVMWGLVKLSSLRVRGRARTTLIMGWC
jgi:hypothetical protein